MMTDNVKKEIAALEKMGVPVLRQRHLELFGEPNRSGNRQYLFRRIAWRLQALEEGDLSERARRRAAELARDADLRVRPPLVPPVDAEPGEVATEPFRVTADRRLPMPGTWLTREYKGQTVQVRVLRQGFEFEGEIYRSLSAVARKITGSHWNGWLFFGMAQPVKGIAKLI